MVISQLASSQHITWTKPWPEPKAWASFSFWQPKAWVADPSDRGDSPFADLDATKRSNDQDEQPSDQDLNQ